MEKTLAILRRSHYSHSLVESERNASDPTILTCLVPKYPSASTSSSTPAEQTMAPPSSHKSEEYYRRLQEAKDRYNMECDREDRRMLRRLNCSSQDETDSSDDHSLVESERNASDPTILTCLMPKYPSASTSSSTPAEQTMAPPSSHKSEEYYRRLQEAKDRYNMECDREDRRMLRRLNGSTQDENDSSDDSSTSSEGSTSFYEPEYDSGRVTFGFLGLDRMCHELLRELKRADVTIFAWDPSEELMREVGEIGANMKATPKMVVAAADVVFCFSSDSRSASSAFLEGEGALGDVDASKAIVQNSGLRHETSTMLHKLITDQGARYLEAQFIGTHYDSREHRMVWVASGDMSVYNEIHQYVSSVCTYVKYLGPTIGKAISFNLVISLQEGIQAASLAECIVTIERMGMRAQEFLDCFRYTDIANDYVMCLGYNICNEELRPAPQAMQHPLSDVRRNLSIAVGAQDVTPAFGRLPIASAALQHFVRAGRLGLGPGCDISALIRSVEL